MRHSRTAIGGYCVVVDTGSRMDEMIVRAEMKVEYVVKCGYGQPKEIIIAEGGGIWCGVSSTMVRKQRGALLSREDF